MEKLTQELHGRGRRGTDRARSTSADCWHAGDRVLQNALCPHQEQQVPNSSHGQGIWEITWQNPKMKAHLQQVLEVVSAHSPKGDFVGDASAARWGV